MCLYLHTEFQVSNIILTRFRQGEGVILSTPPPQHEALKSPPTLGLIQNKESKESDQQYTFLISTELLIDDKTISMSSDNNKHAISSRSGIEVLCKGDTRVFDANKILEFEDAKYTTAAYALLLASEKPRISNFISERNMSKKYYLVNKIFPRWILRIARN